MIFFQALWQLSLFLHPYAWSLLSWKVLKNWRTSNTVPCAEHQQGVHLFQHSSLLPLFCCLPLSRSSFWLRDQICPATNPNEGCVLLRPVQWCPGGHSRNKLGCLRFSQPAVKPRSPLLQEDSLPSEPTGKPNMYVCVYIHTHTHIHIFKQTSPLRVLMLVKCRSPCFHCRIIGKYKGEACPWFVNTFIPVRAEQSFIDFKWNAASGMQSVVLAS